MTGQNIKDRFRTVLVLGLIVIAFVAAIIGEQKNDRNIHPIVLAMIFIIIAVVVLNNVFYRILAIPFLIIQRARWGDMRRIEQGEAVAIRDQFQAKQTKKNLSQKEKTILAYAYSNTGDFAAAAETAQSVLDTFVKIRQLPLNKSRTPDTAVNNALFFLYHALNHQGKFIEAAQVLQTYHFGLMNGRAVMAAISFFFGDDEAQARAALGDLRVTGDTPPPRRVIVNTPNTTESVHNYPYPSRIWLAYLRHKLFGEDPRPILKRYAPYIEPLTDPLPVLVDSPYTLRYRQCLAEIHELAES